MVKVGQNATSHANDAIRTLIQMSFIGITFTVLPKRGPLLEQ